MLAGRIKGITWFEIGGVAAILSIVGVAAYFVWVRHLRHQRERDWAASCQGNIIKIETVVEEWAIANNKTDGATVTMRTLFDKGLLKKAVRCPAGGSYGQVFTVGCEPECDYTPPAWFDTQYDRYRHYMERIQD